MITTSKYKTTLISENDEVIIPDNMVELQEFLEIVWDEIFVNNNEYQIGLYNKAAEKYNKQAKFPAITIINNFKQLQQHMTAKKAAVKKAAPKKAVAKKAAPKKAVAKKAAPKKIAALKPVAISTPKVDGEKKLSQKFRIVKLAEEGKTIDEIVELSGIKKANVQWYFSKLKLGK